MVGGLRLASLAGHNDYAAWTQTVAHTDIEDLFLIELNEEGTHYYYGGKQYPLKFIEHNIYVKVSLNPKCLGLNLGFLA